MKIYSDKIGSLIDSGGKNIKRITEITGAQININENNSQKILIFIPSEEALKVP
jgi:polyribonucleotide nucleotidyltransferase